MPPITVDKHKVLQILVNLVRNAKYACDESGRSDKLLTLRVEQAPAGVRICVIDNGVGIPAENMSRLFTHGFTTRADGHGFGLHSGALAAQELGGSLRVTSDGPGRGANIHSRAALRPRGAGPWLIPFRSPTGAYLIIDDNAAIHLDFRKVLGAQAEHSAQAALDVLEANLFGEAVAASARPNFDIDSAHQGQEGVTMARQALAEGTPLRDGFRRHAHAARLGWPEDHRASCGRWIPDVQSRHLLGPHRLRLDRGRSTGSVTPTSCWCCANPPNPSRSCNAPRRSRRKWENDRLVRDQMLRLEEVINDPHAGTGGGEPAAAASGHP